MNKNDWYTCFRTPYTLNYHCEKGDVFKKDASSLLLHKPVYIPQRFLHIYFKFLIATKVTVEEIKTNE
jgi:hypothetical protein